MCFKHEFLFFTYPIQMLARLAEKLARNPSLISSIELVQIPKTGTCLSIHLSNGERATNLKVPLVWFRDNCRSDLVYNHDTDQRTSKMLNIMDEARIVSQNAVTYHDNKLSIEWADGHNSVFTSEELTNLMIKPQQKAPHSLYHLWNGATLGTIPRLNRSSFSLPEFSRKFVQFGITAVDGIGHSIEATKILANEIAPFDGTFYGDISTISNDDGADNLADSAYTNEEIGPHTDISFFSQTLGVVAFHCLHPAANGGETMLIDAFTAAERLKHESPSAFRALTTTLIDHEYIERGDKPMFARASSKAVIELNADDGYRQIRFNPYHRAPLRLSPNGENGLSTADEIAVFYEAYQAFSRICHDPGMATTIKLMPGTVLFMDNHRILHARTAFSGYRQMCGCFLSRDNLMATARPHLEENVRLLV